MRIKLIAMGNILMEDDGIAIVVAWKLKDQLTGMGLQVICGETDIGYCMDECKECDYLILLDATFLQSKPGGITRMSLQEVWAGGRQLSQHGIRFTDLLRIHYPHLDGVLLGIEAASVSFCSEISPQLLDRLEDITKDILNTISDILQCRRNEIC